MHGTRGIRHIRRAAIIAATAIAMSGCLESGSFSQDYEEIVISNSLSGSVGDGPVVGAVVKIRRSDGEMVTQVTSDTNGNYGVSIRTKAKNYPLTIEALGGVDLVTNNAPDFDLAGAVVEFDDITIANANPFTTIAVEIARELPGGLSPKNILAAESYVTAALSSGLSTVINTGPMRTRIDATNIAEMVKSSESLAEIIRRTRDLILLNGRSTSGNQVLRALASDLTDTIIDGVGSTRTEPRTSAIATVVAVAVFLESMQDELHVNGQDAMAAMDAAIMRVSASSPSRMTGDINVTGEMIYAVRIGLIACLAVENNSRIADLLLAFVGVQPGMDSVLIRTLLPADYRQTLAAVLDMIASADDAIIATINTAVRAGLDDPTFNQAPTIFGSPATSIIAGSNYSFTPSAADPEGDLLTFSIVNRPGWASFSTATGRLSGTPTVGNAGSYNNIVISVSDGEFSASLATFAINVVHNNSAPTISGSPPVQVNANELYTFTPTASDPDGDALMFSVANLPGWANFNTASGGISGTPGDADVGIASNIRITVTDGSSSVTLGPFSITVTSISLGSATLSWTPPIENEDGTAIIDLAGYRIYWGTTPGSYPNSVSINNPGVVMFVVDNLVPGSYEFAITAFNTAGVESVYSNTATKIVL